MPVYLTAADTGTLPPGDRATTQAVQDRRLPERAHALLRVASAVAGTACLDELLPALARAAAAAVGADQASVFVYDEARTRTIAAGHYASGNPLDLAGLAKLEDLDGYPPDAIPAEAEVIRTRRPLLRDRTTPFPDPVPTIAWRSDAVVPMLAQGEILGVLHVRETARERVFDVDDLALLEAIGRQAGLAVLRVREAAAAARRAEHLAVLNQAGQALALSLDEDELCAIVHEQVRRVLTVDAFLVGLVDAERGELRLPYLFDAARRWPAAVAPLGHGPAGRAVRTGQSLVVDHRRDSPEIDAVQFGDPTRRVQSAIFVPMRRDGRVLGVLSAQSYGEGAYDPDDVRTLETVAQQAAAAFAHARLVAEAVAARQAAERHAADLEAVMAITRVIASAPDLPTMLATMADELGALLPHDELVLFRLRTHADGAHLVPELVRGDGAAPLPGARSLATDQGLVGTAFSSGKALLVNDAHLDPRSDYPLGDPTPYRTAGEHALVAPLAVAGQPIGVLFANRIGGQPFRDDEFARLRLLAEQAAVAIRNAMLREDAELARGAQARQAANLEAVLAISRTIASAADLPAMLDVLADEVATLIPHREIALYRLTESGRLVPALYRIDGVDANDPAWSLAVGQGRVPSGRGSAFARCEAELVNDAHLDPRSIHHDEEDHHRHEGEHTMQAPLLVAGRPIGVLHLARDGDRPFDDEEFSTFRALAEQAAVAIHNAALLDEARTAHAQTARHAANLEAVLTTTRAITARLDLDETIGALADHLARLIPHNRFTVWRLDESDRRFHASFNRVDGGEARFDVTIPLDASLIGSIFESPQTALLNDDHLAPGWITDRDPFSDGRPIHKLIAPLVHDGRPIGAIVLARYGDDRFDADDLGVFRVLAGQVEVAVQVSLLYEEERRRHAMSLVAVAAALNRATTIDEVLRQLGATATAAVGVDRCSLYVYDEAAARTIVTHHHGYPDQAALVPWETMPPVEIPVERELLATGRPVVGERLRALLAEQREANPNGQRGGAVLPLRVRDQTLGALYVWSSRDIELARPPHDFDADELALLEAIGDQAAAAIERARLYADSERRVAQLRAIAGVNAAITQTLGLDAMLTAVMDSLRETVHSGWGVVALWDEAAEVLRIAAAWGPDADRYRGLTLPLDSSINGLVFQTGRSINGDLDAGLPFYTPPDSAELGRFVLCVPLRSEGRTIGTLEALRDEPGPFADDDLILYELLAGQIAIGVERARIYEVAVRAREESERQARNVEAVLDASVELAWQTDLTATLQAVSEGVARLVSYNAVAILRHDAATDTLRTLHEQYTAGPMPQLDRIAVGEGITGRAFADREALCVGHAERDSRLNRAVWGTGPELDEPFADGVHVLVVPLIVEGTALGVLALDRFGPEPGPFTEQEFAAVRLFAGQAAAAIRNAELASQNRDLYLGGIRALASAVDQKDRYTRGHSERVSAYARRIADELDLSQHEAELVELAGLLHDIGKIGVPDRILQKPSTLSASERAVLMEHSAIGARMLAEAGAAALQPLVPLVLHHHEHVDGRGYPAGLAGDAIPLGAAIIAVADAFDTMVTNRPYRVRRPVPDAFAELRRCAGTQFEARVVAALERVVANDPLLPTALERGSYPPPDTPASDAPALGSAPDDDIDLSSRTGTGLMGDPRPLQLLIELAGMTRHMPDLETYLDRVAAALHELDYEDVMLFLAEPETGDLRLAAHAGTLRRIPVGTRRPFGLGTAGTVADHGRPLNVTGVLDVPGQVGQWPKPRGSELVMPLIVENGTIGVLSVASSDESAFSRSDETVLTLIAEQVAIAVHVAQLHADARRAAITDGLTGLLNHRAFYEALERAVAAAAPFSVVLFDVEGLKLANDSAGHLAGDTLLRRVADTIRGAVRAGDVVARYGGDEFGAILAGADLATATAAAARVRDDLLAAAESVGSLRTTVRYGAAVFPEDGRTPYELIGGADARLYEMRAVLPGRRLAGVTR